MKLYKSTVLRRWLWWTSWHSLIHWVRSLVITLWHILGPEILWLPWVLLHLRRKLRWHPHRLIHLRKRRSWGSYTRELLHRRIRDWALIKLWLLHEIGSWLVITHLLDIRRLKNLLCSNISSVVLVLLLLLLEHHLLILLSFLIVRVLCLHINWRSLNLRVVHIVALTCIGFHLYPIHSFFFSYELFQEFFYLFISFSSNTQL